MGMNVVLIVDVAEEKEQSSVADFEAGLKSDQWGQFATMTWDEKATSWFEFEWEGKRYFSWSYTPRIVPLDLFNLEHDGINPENPVQMTFLKAMLVVERLAGGAIYVGNDVVSYVSVEDAETFGDSFILPAPLDHVLPNWRDVKDVEVDDPHLVF